VLAKKRLERIGLSGNTLVMQCSVHALNPRIGNHARSEPRGRHKGVSELQEDASDIVKPTLPPVEARKTERRSLGSERVERVCFVDVRYTGEAGFHVRQQPLLGRRIE